MPVRMTQIVYQDPDGVVHYRLFDPETVCGRGVHHAGGRSIRIGDGLPLSRVTVLPRVTCMTCIAEAEDPHWA